MAGPCTAVSGVFADHPFSTAVLLQSRMSVATGGSASEYWPARLATELTHLDSRRQKIDAHAEFQLDAVRRTQDSRLRSTSTPADGCERGGSGTPSTEKRGAAREVVDVPEKLPGRALCMLHKRPPVVTIDGSLGKRLPQDTIVEQRSLL